MMAFLKAAQAKAIRCLRDSPIVPTQVRRLIWRKSVVRALPVDVYVTLDEVVVVASVAGMAPGDVAVSFQGGVLAIEGAFLPPVENVAYVLHEREEGRFRRKLKLRSAVDARYASATIRNGLLTVVLPKTSDAQATIVRVPIEA